MLAEVEILENGFILLYSKIYVFHAESGSFFMKRNIECRSPAV